MTVRERIQCLQKRMRECGIQVYLVPTADYHGSEYVGDYFKTREFLTGFTGSAGTAVILQDQAYLWTDGRYFIQAARELEGSGILLQRSGEDGVPTIREFLKQMLPEQGNIGFDGRTVGMADGIRYEKIAREKGGSVLYDRDLAGELWTDRPSLSMEPAFGLELQYAGVSAEEKISRVRQKMKENQADVLVITSLDDIGWLLNIRGADVAFCPLLLSYLVVKMDGLELYAEEGKFSAEMKQNFQKEGIELYPYEALYERMKTFRKDETILLDPQQMNYALFRNLPEGVRTVQKENPVLLMKAVKNPTEIENIRKAHLKDGVAQTKFLYWLKQAVERNGESKAGDGETQEYRGKTEQGAGKETISVTELTASAKLEEFRSRQEHFLGPSFSPICAYGEHGAIVHYSASPETDVELRPEGLFLTDTGGHYLEGSTDITRTVALGKLCREEQEHFTTVVCSMLRLADARFLYGCTGMSLDYAAREPFWRAGLNYNHGTGHGVGYLGNIHEGPVRFSWKPAPGGDVQHLLEPGMVITDEPGIYIEGSHGIRIENELLVSEGEKNAYGQFLYFEVLTYVPIDLDAILPERMTEEERNLLNAYHREVYRRIGPHLTEEERDWLKQYTREI